MPSPVKRPRDRATTTSVDIEDALDNFDAIHATPQRAFEACGETAYFVVNGVVRVAEEIRDALGIG